MADQRKNDDEEGFVESAPPSLHGEGEGEGESQGGGGGLGVGGQGKANNNNEEDDEVLELVEANPLFPASEIELAPLPKGKRVSLPPNAHPANDQPQEEDAEQRRVLDRSIAEVEARLPSAVLTAKDIAAAVPAHLHARLASSGDAAAVRAAVEQRVEALLAAAKARLGEEDYERFRSVVVAKADGLKTQLAAAAERADGKVDTQALVSHANQIFSQLAAVLAARAEMQAKLRAMLDAAKGHMNEDELRALAAKGRDHIANVAAQLQDMDAQAMAAKAGAALSAIKQQAAKNIDLAEIKALVSKRVEQGLERAQSFLPPDQVAKLRGTVQGKLQELFARMDELDRDEVKQRARQVLQLVQGGAGGLFQAAMDKFSGFQESLALKKKSLLDKSAKLREMLQGNADTATLVKHLLLENVSELRGTVFSLVQNEMVEITKSVHQVLRARDTLPNAEESLNYVLAGIISPFRLKLEYWAVQFTLLHSLLLLVAVGVLLGLDWERSCDVALHAVSLRVYFVVFGGVQFVNVATRTFFFWELRRFWAQYSFQKVLLQNQPTDPNLGFRSMAEAQQSALQEALEDMTEIGEEAVALKYKMDKSHVGTMLVPVHLFFTAWRCVGVWLWFESQCEDCAQDNLAWLLSATTLEFMLFLTYHVTYLAVSVYVFVLNFAKKDALVEQARALDKKHFGFPLLEGLLSQFVLKDTAHVRKIVGARKAHKISMLERQRRGLCKELKHVEDRIQTAQRQLERMQPQRRFSFRRSSKSMSSHSLGDAPGLGPSSRSSLSVAAS